MTAMPSRMGGGGRSSSRDRDGKAAPKKKFFVRRRKVCKFCAEKLEYVDWKDVKLLQGFIPERGKILPRRISGVCALHQRKLQTAIKRARAAKGDTLCFAHGHVLRVVGARWIGLPPVGGENLALGTASISVLGWDRVVPILSHWNVGLEFD